MKTLRVDSTGQVATFRLARPEVRNALDEALISELSEAFATLGASTRVVVLAGEGESFCAGADAQWMKRSKAFTREENERDAATLASLLKAIDECPRPVIARVQGAALGGGAGLVSACDIVVAEEGAQFGFPEVRLGLIPAVISTFVLTRIGERSARRYFLTGERFGAVEAKAIGLVHEVTRPELLEGRIDELTREVLRGGPQALAAAKQLIRDISGLPRDRAIEHAVRSIAGIRVSPEAQEGLSAFLEKRKPHWP
jgi:methylglutaconyl-CoA hydratase